jgi:hypothetical protein
VHRPPVRDGSDYIDGGNGEVLPTWEEAVEAMACDPDAKSAHVVRFGSSADTRRFHRTV